jgi:hypothetical protein
MKNIKNKSKKLLAFIFLTSVLTGCNRPLDSDPNYYYNQSTVAAYNALAQQQQVLQQQIQQLKQQQGQACNCSDTSQATTETKTSSTKTTTKKDTTTTTKKDETKDTTTTTPETKTETKTPTTTDSTTDAATKIMEKLLQGIKGATYIEALVNKKETKLATGEVTENELKLYAKNTGLTKIEVLYSSKTSTGTKLLYTHGEEKVKVRPAGALSLITTSIDMMDDRLTSSNGWPLNHTDFYGMADRLGSTAYKPEVLGKSNVDNTEVFIVKLTKKDGANEMDSRIKYEQIYYDPKTYMVKLWEAYDGNGTEPFFKINIKEMKFHTSLDDSYFKL